MNRRVVAPAIVLLVLLVACSSPEEGNTRAQHPKTPRVAGNKDPGKKKDEKIKARDPTGPKKAQVINDALRVGTSLTRRSISDLKKMGYWDNLTKRIFVVRVSSRVGSVPADAHLADSLWTYYQDPDTKELGDLCDVIFFTRAVKDDVARQEVYYAQGRLDHPPPSLAQFWTVLLAHELAHCSKRGQRGERYSTSWETRILDGYGIARVGS
jgi:hypothetical protein